MTISYFYSPLTIISYHRGMNESVHGDHGPDDFTRNNIRDDERKVVAIASAIAPSLVFNAVALPPNLPDHIKSALMARADQARDAAVEAGFVQPTAADGIGYLTREERQRRDDEKNGEYLGVIMAQEERRRREQEVWSHTKSTVGGVTMTGAEWSEVAHRLRNDEDLRRRVMDAFKDQGMSEREAEARYERAADIAEIAAIPPSQRTSEQTATMKQAETDPTLKRDMDIVKAEMDAGMTNGNKAKLSGAFAYATEGAEVQSEKVTPTPTPVIQTAGMGF